MDCRADINTDDLFEPYSRGGSFGTAGNTLMSGTLASGGSVVAVYHWKP
jgi:hypothetical protein